MSNNALYILIPVITSLLLFIWARFFCKKYFLIIVIGFIARLFIIYFHEETRIFQDLDVNDFLPYFTEFSETGIHDLASFIKPHTAFYTVMYPGWIFNSLGESGLWVIRVINAALGVTCVGLLTWLNQIVFGKKLSQFQAFIIMFWPTWIRYTIEVGRTSSTVFMVLFGICGLLTIITNTKSITNIAIIFFTFMALVFSCLLRTHYIAYFIPILALSLFTRVKSIKISPYLRTILYFLSFLITIMLTLGMLSLYQQFGQYNQTTELLDLQQDVVRIATSGEDGGSAYLKGVYPSSPIDWLWYLPLQAFYFMLSPMPWDIRSAFAIGSSIQAWLLFILCLNAWQKRRTEVKQNEMLKLLLITIVFVAIALGAGVKNAGSAERWRLPSTLIVITTATSVIEHFKTNKKLSLNSISYKNKLVK
ncbi:hypothetical protein CAL7716_043370 [Calothrix sp. PCC 7716]|nr:hypothetical protein CAL7716_043370 [Calothrix sp. PCC 7716]